MNKLIKQIQLLLNSPAILKQKLKIVDIVIRLGIAYSFYAVPYSMPNIAKLDQKTPQTSPWNYHMTNLD